MSKMFVKTWVMECSFIAEHFGPDIEKLAKMGTPPQGSNYRVLDKSLRVVSSNLKEVKEHDEQVPDIDGGNQGKGKEKKDDFIQDIKTKKKE